LIKTSGSRLLKRLERWLILQASFPASTASVEIAASAVKWTSAKASMDAVHVLVLVVMDPLVSVRRTHVSVLKDAVQSSVPVMVGWCIL